MSLKQLIRLQELVEKKERRISLDKARQIGKLCDIHTEEELCRMLTEFRDIGLLMWHSEEGRRDLIILDVQWMLNAMTQLLCQRSIEAKRRSSHGMRQ